MKHLSFKSFITALYEEFLLLEGKQQHQLMRDAAFRKKLFDRLMAEYHAEVKEAQDEVADGKLSSLHFVRRDPNDPTRMIAHSRIQSKISTEEPHVEMLHPDDFRAKLEKDMAHQDPEHVFKTVAEHMDLPENMEETLKDNDTPENRNAWNQHINWVLHRYAHGGIEKLTDIPKAFELLKHFHKLTKTASPKEIGTENGEFGVEVDENDKPIKEPTKRYEAHPTQLAKWKNLSDLQKFVENKNPLRVSGLSSKDYTLVAENEHWWVSTPHTERAACALGSDTTWCTTGNHFENYNNRGPLYIFIPKNPQIQKKEHQTEKYQMHFESGEFRDASQEPINTSTTKDLKNNRPFPGFPGKLARMLHEFDPYRGTVMAMADGDGDEENGDRDTIEDTFKNMSKSEIEELIKHGHIDAVAKYHPDSINKTNIETILKSPSATSTKKKLLHTLIRPSYAQNFKEISPLIFSPQMKEFFISNGHGRLLLNDEIREHFKNHGQPVTEHDVDRVFENVGKSKQPTKEDLDTLSYSSYLKPKHVLHMLRNPNISLRHDSLFDKAFMELESRPTVETYREFLDNREELLNHPSMAVKNFLLRNHKSFNIGEDDVSKMMKTSIDVRYPRIKRPHGIEDTGYNSSLQFMKNLINLGHFDSGKNKDYINQIINSKNKTLKDALVVASVKHTPHHIEESGIQYTEDEYNKLYDGVSASSKEFMLSHSNASESLLLKALDDKEMVKIFPNIISSINIEHSNHEKKFTPEVFKKLDEKTRADEEVHYVYSESIGNLVSKLQRSKITGNLDNHLKLKENLLQHMETSPRIRDILSGQSKMHRAFTTGLVRNYVTVKSMGAHIPVDTVYKIVKNSDITDYNIAHMAIEKGIDHYTSDDLHKIIDAVDERRKVISYHVDVPKQMFFDTLLKSKNINSSHIDRLAKTEQVDPITLSNHRANNNPNIISDHIDNILNPFGAPLTSPALAAAAHDAATIVLNKVPYKDYQSPYQTYFNHLIKHLSYHLTENDSKHTDESKSIRFANLALDNALKLTHIHPPSMTNEIAKQLLSLTDDSDVQHKMAKFILKHQQPGSRENFSEEIIPHVHPRTLLGLIGDSSIHPDTISNSPNITTQKLKDALMIHDYTDLNHTRGASVITGHEKMKDQFSSDEINKILTKLSHGPIGNTSSIIFNLGQQKEFNKDHFVHVIKNFDSSMGRDAYFNSKWYLGLSPDDKVKVVDRIMDSNLPDEKKLVTFEHSGVPYTEDQVIDLMHPSRGKLFIQPQYRSILPKISEKGIKRIIDIYAQEGKNFDNAESLRYRTLLDQATFPDSRRGGRGLTQANVEHAIQISDPWHLNTIAGLFTHELTKDHINQIKDKHDELLKGSSLSDKDKGYLESVELQISGRLGRSFNPLNHIPPGGSAYKESLQKIDYPLQHIARTRDHEELKKFSIDKLTDFYDDRMRYNVPDSLIQEHGSKLFKDFAPVLDRRMENYGDDQEEKTHLNKLFETDQLDPSNHKKAILLLQKSEHILPEHIEKALQNKNGNVDNWALNRLMGGRFYNELNPVYGFTPQRRIELIKDAIDTGDMAKHMTIAEGRDLAVHHGPEKDNNFAEWPTQEEDHKKLIDHFIDTVKSSSYSSGMKTTVFEALFRNQKGFSNMKASRFLTDDHIEKILEHSPDLKEHAPNFDAEKTES